MKLSKLAESLADPATLRLNATAARLKAEGEPVIHLGGGEPESPAPPAARRNQCVLDRRAATRSSRSNTGRRVTRGQHGGTPPSDQGGSNQQFSLRQSGVFGVHPLGCPQPANTLKRGHQTGLDRQNENYWEATELTKPLLPA